MKKLYIGIILLLSLYSLGGLGQDTLTQEEKENEIIDYSNIQKVLKKDGLQGVQKQRVQTVKKIKQAKEKISEKRYDYPSEDDFWRIVSELWLVKNAQILRWDFPKPEYGITQAFQSLLEQFGYYNVKFQVLIVNTPAISHFALPTSKNEFIFVLSLPFMRSLDLTKVDISLLMLEDYFRLKRDSFIKNLKFDKKIIGGNFKKGGFSKELFVPLLKEYSRVILTDGFTFEQEFHVTKDMDLILKGTPPLWGAYFKLYTKIDRFVKTDALFKRYLKIYPSPELKLKWLSPKKKVI